MVPDFNTELLHNCTIAIGSWVSRDCQSPYKSLNRWVQDAGKQEEGCDQDVEQWEGGEGHSGGQISVGWAVHMYMHHKRLHSKMQIGLIYIFYIKVLLNLW